MYQVWKDRVLDTDFMPSMFAHFVEKEVLVIHIILSESMSYCHLLT